MRLLVVFVVVALLVLPTVAQDEAQPITVENAARLANLMTLDEHLDAVTNIAFSADGLMLASVSDDTALRLWSLEDGALLGEYYEHLSFVKGVDFHPIDPTVLVTSSWDRTVYVWEVTDEAASVRDIFQGYLAVIEDVAFSPDGDMLAFGVGDGTLRIADMSTLDVVQSVQLNALQITDVVYGPDGAQVAAAGGFPDNTATLVDASSGDVTRLSGHDGAVTAIAFAPDGRVVTGGDDATVRFWVDGESVARWTVDDWVTDLAFTPDGSVLAVALQDGTVQVWDSTEGEMLASFDAHDGPVSAVRFNASGTMLASAGEEGVVRVWGLR